MLMTEDSSTAIEVQLPYLLLAIVVMFLGLLGQLVYGRVSKVHFAAWTLLTMAVSSILAAFAFTDDLGFAAIFGLIAGALFTLIIQWSIQHRPGRQ